MKREIKFRGIKKETKGEWIYGGYFSNTDEEGLEHFIFEVYNGGNPVYDHTIGQFTGLKDKNGVNIYEGDILEYKNEFGRHHLSKIFYKTGGLCYSIHDDDFYKIENEIYFYESCADMQSKGWIIQFEVIGNIYENPKLLNK